MEEQLANGKTETTAHCGWGNASPETGDEVVLDLTMRNMADGSVIFSTLAENRGKGPIKIKVDHAGERIRLIRAIKTMKFGETAQYFTWASEVFDWSSPFPRADYPIELTVTLLGVQRSLRIGEAREEIREDLGNESESTGPQAQHQQIVGQTMSRIEGRLQALEEMAQLLAQNQRNVPTRARPQRPIHMRPMLHQGLGLLFWGATMIFSRIPDRPDGFRIHFLSVLSVYAMIAGLYAIVWSVVEDVLEDDPRYIITFYLSLVVSAFGYTK